MGDTKELLEKVRILTKIIENSDEFKVEHASSKEAINFPDEDLSADVVSWTRLYNSDDLMIREIADRTSRKKSQIIRMLVHAGLKRGIIDEFN